MDRRWIEKKAKRYIRRYSRWRCGLIGCDFRQRKKHGPANTPLLQNCSWTRAWTSTKHWILVLRQCNRRRLFLHHEQPADLRERFRPGRFGGFRLLDVVSDRSWRKQAERASQGDANKSNNTFSAGSYIWSVWKYKVIIDSAEASCFSLEKWILNVYISAVACITTTYEFVLKFWGENHHGHQEQTQLPFML